MKDGALNKMFSIFLWERERVKIRREREGGREEDGGICKERERERERIKSNKKELVKLF
jgi:hypothetical protein